MSYNKLPLKDRMCYLKLYKEANPSHSYRQAVNSFGDGGMIPTIYPPSVNNIINPPKHSYESDINKYLYYSMDRARDFAEKENADHEDGGTDNLRHPMAGRLVSEAIQSRTRNIPIVSKALGFLGSTALGISHEITEPNRGTKKLPYTYWDTFREAGEDIINNTVGAAIGSIPISSEHKTNILKHLSNNNYLPDGYANNSSNMYIKH